MSRLRSRLLGFGLFLALPGAVLGPAGCADNKSTLFIQHVLAIPDDCAFKADPSAAFVDAGVLDLQFADTYLATLLIGNQLVPQGNDNTLKTETSRVELKGAEVHLTTAQGGAVASYTTASSGVVDPVAGPTPGYGTTGVVLIPGGIGPGDYLAAVTVFGETLGNRDVETGEFVFPIRVCDGCRVFFNKESIDAGTCVAPSGDPIGTCFPGQDHLTDCTLRKQ